MSRTPAARSAASQRYRVESGDGLFLTRLPPNEGTWYIPNLNLATYQLKIEATGFKTYVQNGIVLRTAEQPVST